MPKVFLSIQGLRGIAALLVVVHHYYGVYGSIHKLVGGDLPWLFSYGNVGVFGAVGVPIFFVVSGFVIGLQRFEIGAAGVYDFMVKRVSRILPLYWVMTLAYVCWASQVWTWPQLGRSLLFLERPITGQLPALGVGWTLEYEMFFYIAFAVVVVSGIVGTRVRGAAILISVFVLMVYVNLSTDAAVLGFSGSPVILEFCGGLIIASTIQNCAVTRLWLAYLVFALAILILSTTAFVGESRNVIFSMWGAGAFFLVFGLAAAEVEGRVFMRGRPFQMLGAASYAIYLAHLVVQGSFFKWPIWYWRWYEVIEPHLGLLLMLSFATAWGLAIHYGFEVWANAWFRRWLLQWSPSRLQLNHLQIADGDGPRIPLSLRNRTETLFPWR
ncbi:acyltransferase [Mesorhizobium sp. M0802]|uniref:acyltransferase family protein n=1 Tax=Mesorhizobium sp. M0802 TaxID=2957001 RepID=UPI00333B5CA0